MRTAFAYAGWLVAAIAAVTAGSLFVSARHQAGEVARLQVQGDALRQQVRRLDVTVTDLNSNFKFGKLGFAGRAYPESEKLAASRGSEAGTPGRQAEPTSLPPGAVARQD